MADLKLDARALRTAISAGCNEAHDYGVPDPNDVIFETAIRVYLSTLPGHAADEWVRKYATRLLVSLMEKHYPDRSPDWAPLPDLYGVLTQIDNLSTGLCRTLAPQGDAAVLPPDVERVAWAMAEVIAKRHDTDPEYWMGDPRREEARVAIAAFQAGESATELLGQKPGERAAQGTPADARAGETSPSNPSVSDALTNLPTRKK